MIRLDLLFINLYCYLLIHQIFSTLSLLILKDCLFLSRFLMTYQKLHLLVNKTLFFQSNHIQTFLKLILPLLFDYEILIKFSFSYQDLQQKVSEARDHEKSIKCDYSLYLANNISKSTDQIKFFFQTNIMGIAVSTKSKKINNFYQINKQCLLFTLVLQLYLFPTNRTSHQEQQKYGLKEKFSCKSQVLNQMINWMDLRSLQNSLISIFELEKSIIETQKLILKLTQWIAYSQHNETEFLQKRQQLSKSHTNQIPLKQCKIRQLLYKKDKKEEIFQLFPFHILISSLKILKFSFSMIQIFQQILYISLLSSILVLIGDCNFILFLFPTHLHLTIITQPGFQMFYQIKSKIGQISFKISGTSNYLFFYIYKQKWCSQSQKEQQKIL
ncbi:transmembrane protein, putative (macronuclear) [Tetrahymena thermophila SB210]|uniref:Transmembrane protein, putative n=1 Tax=Tetrahymena thermophila (strain SB210) TaxID=312017 RepID=W7X336_TETTS|nr:transmembrane protein, putative [Tetrahymena thermophila SB210]EWS71862.1 transmembrane protein, putative [Tetrahymena thermophila SB210]|eukprot:XP_012655606.1 transmembrane protein, putative [Tetrahymena thermophila SB210]